MQTLTKSMLYNPCANRRKCTKTYICGSNCHVTHFLRHRQNYCSLCADCNENCSDFAEYKCAKLEKAPYVCNPCRHIKSCTLEKRMYDAKEAQNAYEKKRSESRQGIDLTQDKVQLMMNHINSYTRKKLNNRSAYQLFSFLYGDEIADKLEMKAIPANEIILKPKLLNKKSN